MAGGRAVLVVYSRDGCHLCDEMVAGLRSLQARHAFCIEVVDIGPDPELEARYGEDVPVLLAGGQELCRHRLDAERVSSWLSRAPEPPATTDRVRKSGRNPLK